MSLSELLTPQGNGGIYGAVIGIVTNNSDPEGLGRVKVQFPWLSEQDESNWARIATWLAGPQKGAFFLPEVGDEVLLVFEHGDIARPYVLGTLWNGKDEPPVKSDQENNVKMIRTRSGITVAIHDKQGEARLSISDKDQKNRIEIDLKDKKIKIEAEKDVEIKAKGRLRLDAKEIEIKTSADAKIEIGGQMKLKTSGNMELKASGNADIKGAMINLN